MAFRLALAFCAAAAQLSRAPDALQEVVREVGRRAQQEYLETLLLIPFFLCFSTFLPFVGRAKERASSCFPMGRVVSGRSLDRSLGSVGQSGGRSVGQSAGRSVCW